MVLVLYKIKFFTVESNSVVSSGLSVTFPSKKFSSRSKAVALRNLCSSSSMGRFCTSLLLDNIRMVSRALCIFSTCKNTNIFSLHVIKRMEKVTQRVKLFYGFVNGEEKSFIVIRTNFEVRFKRDPA